MNQAENLEFGSLQIQEEFVFLSPNESGREADNVRKEFVDQGLSENVNSLPKKCRTCSYPNDEGIETCIICLHSLVVTHEPVVNVTIKEKVEEEKAKVGQKEMLFDINIDEDERKNKNEKKVWECKLCKCVCVPTTVNCEACLEMRDSSDVPESEFPNDQFWQPDEKWLCNTCDTFNLVDVFKCTKCSSLADFIDKWKCERCTFDNRRLSVFCVTCLKTNDNLGKCAQCRKSIIDKQFGDDLCSKCFEEKKKKEMKKRHSYKADQKMWKMVDNDEEKEKKAELFFIQDPLYKTFFFFKKPVNRKLVPDSEQKSSMAFQEHENQESFYRRKLEQWKRRCKNCQKMLHENREVFCCRECEQYRWYCNNSACNGINFICYAYCQKCNVQRNSDLSDCQSFSKWINNREVVLFQCDICLRFNDDQRSQCVNCGRQRKTPSRYKQSQLYAGFPFPEFVTKNKFLFRLAAAGYWLYFQIKNRKKFNEK